MTAKPDMMSVALAYVQRGWSVIPLHVPVVSSDDLACSCGKRTCDSIGKHPRTKRGLSDASRDPDVVRGWWTRWTDANIGVVTGNASSGLVVLDVDNGNGRNGDDSIRDLESAGNALPETPISLTGNGMHVLMLSTQEIPNSANLVGNGLDIRGEGGYVVAPPSLHRSGRRYEWEGSSHPDDIPIALVPQWLLDLATNKRRKPGRQESGEPIQEGSRNETLFRLGCKLRRSGLSEDAILAALATENAKVCVPPLADEELQKISASAAKYDAGDPYYAAQTHAPASASPAALTNPDWTSLLIRKPPNKQGVAVPVADVANAGIILTHEPQWRGLIIWDAFRREERTIRPPPWLDEDRPSGEPSAGLWTDEDNTRLRNWLAREYDLRLPTAAIAEAVRIVAQRNSAHPVEAYLSAIEWDGVPRLHSWLTTYLGVPECEYASAVGRWWMISAVARIFDPGCKADHAIILEGPQGAGKSSALRALVPTSEWFADTPFKIGDKDAFMALRGRWIVELAELDSLSKSDANTAKAFITGQEDSFRPPYARSFIQAKRQCVFAGTVNPDAVGYLTDSTGGRRFWPVVCDAIDADGIAASRDQLWAEAVVMYRDGKQWHPDPASIPMLQEQQQERYRSDIWEPTIAEWLSTALAKVKEKDNGGYITMADVLNKALEIEPSRWTRGEQVRVGNCLSALGWSKARKRLNGALTYVYVRPCEKDYAA